MGGEVYTTSTAVEVIPGKDDSVDNLNCQYFGGEILRYSLKQSGTINCYIDFDD